ncbi:MAG: prepilin peptidase [Burkholderiales bacterium]|nr:prepilin peptidase [Burkholderiales bacterium]
MSPLDVLAASPTLFVVYVFVFGLAVGSFLNVVIHRLPKMMEAEFRQECAMLDAPEDAEPPARPRYNLSVPRSACPSCGAQIAAHDNIPVLSWLLLRGKCRHCGHPISVRYPAVELTTGLISAGIALHFGYSLATLGGLLFGFVLVALFFIDADTFLLPDSLTLPLLWAGLLFNLRGIYTSLPSAVIGAVAGYLLLWSVYWLFKLVTGKEGMGYGDFKLLAAIGAWLGWASLPIVILMSSMVGAIIGIAMVLLSRHGWGKPLPFGPYLAAAGLVTLIWGQDIAALIWH